MGGVHYPVTINASSGLVLGWLLSAKGSGSWELNTSLRRGSTPHAYMPMRATKIQLVMTSRMKTTVLAFFWKSPTKALAPNEGHCRGLVNLPTV